jgi:hypothetical protein
MNKFTKTITSIVSAVAFVAVLSAAANADTFTRSLTVGSRGADVTTLQMGLKAKGYLASEATGYFGNLTKAAVAAFQTANGITPAAGYFGPLTQAKWNAATGTGSTSTVPGCVAGAMFSATTGASCTGGSTTSTLKGTDGSIDSVSKLSQYNNEEVGEGEDTVKVAGFEVEASNDGDIAIKSVKVTFDGSSNTGSTRLNKYVDSVSVWQGSTKLATVSVDDFSKDSSNSAKWSKTVTVSNSVVKSDTKEKFYISVDGATTYDSSDISGDAWSVEVTNIRFEDGSGVVTTDTQSASSTDTEIDFVSFSTSANTELKFSTDSATPEAGVVIVDDTDNTQDVVLTKGKVKVEGTSDVLLEALPITLTSTGTNVVSVTGSVTLTIDGEDYSESVSTTTAALTGDGTSGVITFDNLDLTLTAGKTYSFTVKADINDTDTLFVDGDTLKATITSTNRDAIDAENSQGDQLSDSSEKSGTVTGEAQEFRASGVQLALVSTETSITAGNSANDDLGTFKIKFKVKAVGDTVYVASLAGTSGAALDLFSVEKSGVATTGNTITGTITNISDTTLSAGYNYEIEDGSEETFELIVTAQLGTGGTSGQYRALLSAIKWNTTDSSGTFNSYTSNLDSFKTSYVGLN